VNKLLFLALFFTSTAFASPGNDGCVGNCGNNGGGSEVTSTSSAVGVGVAGSSASVNVEGDSVDIPKTASSAVAPSVSQGTTCPIVSPSSKAASVFFFSGSGTTGTTVNGICVAWHNEDEELVHQIACDSDSSYRRAITKLGRSCD